MPKPKPAPASGKGRHVVYSEVVVPPGTDPLARREDEDREWHRALLFYAVQDPDNRALRAVARAIGRAQSTVQYRHDKHHWAERIEASGPAVQVRALGIYQELYLSDHKASRDAWLVIAPRVTVNLPWTQEEENRAARPKRLTGASQTDPESPRKSEADKLARDVTIVDLTIHEFAKQLKGGKVRVSARDVVHLIAIRRNLREEMERLEHGEAVVSGVAIDVPESYRVRRARATGTDVIAALREDAEDLALTLRAISNQHVVEHEAMQAARSAEES